MSISHIAGPAWIGVDLGTQSVRGLAVDSAGRTMHLTSRPLQGSRAGTRHRQDARQWWQATVSVLSELAQVLGGCPVGGLSVCATSGTTVFVDGRSEPLADGIMYDDADLGDSASGHALVDEVRQAGAELWSALGNQPQPSWPLVKLLHRRRCGDWPEDGLVAHQGDYVMSRLAGRRLPVDSSQALKTGLDPRTVQWPSGLFEQLGLPVDRLPDVVLPGTAIGELSPSASAMTGLPAGTVLRAGTTDGCAAQFAAGAVVPGAWNSVLGTTLVLKGTSRQPVHDPTGVVYSHRAPHGGYWLPGGASSTGAGVISKYFAPGSLTRLEAGLARSAGLLGSAGPAGSGLADLSLAGSGLADVGPAGSGLAGSAHPIGSAGATSLVEVPICYPLLGSGERFPFKAPDAHGFVWASERMQTLDAAATALDEQEFYDAAMLGLACVERLCFDVLDRAGAGRIESVSFTGGGAANATLNQLRCSMLGVPVSIPREADPVLGAAMLAAGDLGDVGVLADRWRRDGVRLEPLEELTAVLLPYYARFVDLLRQQGWLETSVAEHAVARCAA